MDSATTILAILATVIGVAIGKAWGSYGRQTTVLCNLAQEACRGKIEEKLKALIARGISAQVSMETFGAQPFPRIHGIIELSQMTLHQSPEFKFLHTKLVREKNLLEDAFYQANTLIRHTINKLK